MFCKIAKSFRLQYRHLSYVFKMDKAYLRYVEDATKFEISFKYQSPAEKLDRQFNFTRQIQEPVKSFLDRVTVNVDKALNKKSKKKKNKDSEENTQQPGVKVVLLENDTEVDNEIKCEDVLKEDKNVILKINDALYNVIINSPWINAVTLPKSMLAGFPVYPVKLDHSFTNLNQSELKWFKSIDKNSWEKVGEGYFYEPKNSDINAFLKFSILPKNQNREGPEVEVISDGKVEAGPGLCPFENRHKFTNSKCCGNIFRIVTYNLLADLYCDSDYSRTVLFPYCPPYALALDYRKQLILKEMIGYNADIFCLQEVDKKVYNYDLTPILSNLGFESAFSLKGGQVAEGVACFVNKNRFRILESDSLELAKIIEKEEVLKDIWNAISANEQLKERVLERTTVLQLVLVESIDNPNNLILIGNTHLYFHPDADHIRLLQGASCIKLLGKYQKLYSEKFPGKTVKLIFCGDLNSSPDCGIYKLLTEGSVNDDFKDWSSNTEEAVKGLNLSQPFKMQSACGIPKYTNYTQEFKDCLDWIYYDTNQFDVEQVIPLPSDEELGEHIAIPSVVFPSDHVALVADLKHK